MGTEHTETLIIGGGQAGLVTAYELGRRGREYLVVEALDRIGDNWRRHYDSLVLFSPRKLDSLPGLDFPGPAMGLPTKDEVGDYLEAYAAHHDIDVRTGVKVTRVGRISDGFEATTSSGVITSDNVVVATGKVDEPYIPDFAGQLDERIVQLHSCQYKRPDQLAPGPVLVVGAAHSGADIAIEVAATHRTILSGRYTGSLPIRLTGPATRFAAPVMKFVMKRLISVRTPLGRKVGPKFRAGGGPLIDPRREDIENAGVEWTEARTVGAQDAMPLLADGRTLNVANVVWCTGFHHDFSWLDLDLADEDGYPAEESRGVVESVPGLYFVGLTFQSSFASMLFLGVGQDARHVVRHLTARADTRPPVPA